MSIDSELFGSRKAGFRLTVQTTEATLYFENMTPMPVPRVGEEVFVAGRRAGDGFGWWRVVYVEWHLPSFGAQTPTMEAVLTVEWSPKNITSAPVYDEDLGWIRKGQ